ADGTQLWGEHFTRPLSDVSALEADVTRDITGHLRSRVMNAEAKQPAATSSAAAPNAEAYDLYLKGHYLFVRRDEENLPKAVRYYEQAIARDPAYAQAHAELALTYV